MEGSNQDAALQWEIDRLRAQGYEPVFVAFVNAKGHVRAMSSAEPEWLHELLVTMAEEPLAFVQEDEEGC